MTGKEPLCESCKHEKRYHINPDNHISQDKSKCTKTDCFCAEFVGLK